MSGTIQNCTYLFSSFIPLWFFAFISFILISLVGYYGIRSKKICSKGGAALIIAGGLANLYQRLNFGCVLDPYSFFGLFSFNLADAAITVGVLTLLFDPCIKKLLPMIKKWEKRGFS